MHRVQDQPLLQREQLQLPGDNHTQAVPLQERPEEVNLPLVSFSLLNFALPLQVRPQREQLRHRLWHLLLEDLQQGFLSGAAQGNQASFRRLRGTKDTVGGQSGVPGSVNPQKNTVQMLGNL